ncbi:hypothetical protein HID58_022261, partial [Brassica napus]
NPKDMVGETGTLGYMAPFFMIKPYNRRCNVYSFGICCGRFIVVLLHPDLAFADTGNTEMLSNIIIEHMMKC